MTTKNNIKFVGRPVYDAGKRKRLDNIEPIERYSDRGEVIELPAAELQKNRRVFYHPKAADIVGAFPHLYKTVTSKNKS
jgi:hypothetical protein